MNIMCLIKMRIFTIVLSFTWWLLCTKFDDSNGALVGIGDGAFVDTESAPVVINEPNFKIRKVLIIKTSNDRLKNDIESYGCPTHGNVLPATCYAY